MGRDRKIYIGLGVILLLMLFIFSVSSENSTPSALPDTKPQRLVSLSPGNTEILFALGAGKRIVGVSSYSDYPAEAQKIPSVGSYIAPDIEKIIALKPDLVVALKATQAQQIHILNQAGIRVVAVESNSLEEILAAIDTISDAIGEKERGVALHQELSSQLDKVRAATAALPAKRVFVQIWDNPLLTAGNKSFINDVIKQAGGINVAAGKNTDYTPSDIESLYAYQPDVYIISSHKTIDNLSFVKKPELRNVDAIRNQQIYHIDDDLIARPGPRSFSGLIELVKILHEGVNLN